MRKLFFISLVFSFSLQSYSQDNIILSDLKTPNSPGFQILDISPSSIERPTNPKEFSLKILNLFSSGNTIPKNFAFDFSPFWYFKPKNENIYKYLNVKDPDPSIKQLPPLLFGITRKFNLSFASSYSDSTSGTLLKNTNYISIGAKTNILTIRTGRQKDTITGSLLNLAKRMGQVAGRDSNGRRPGIEEIEKQLDEDSAFQATMKVLQRLPLIQLDGAYAYSNALAGNEYSNRRFHRAGAWATLAVNHSFKVEKLDKHEISIIGLFRGIKDNVLTDTARNVFSKTTFIDYGGKLEWTMNRLTLAIEYVKRNYDDNNTNLDSERTVGFAQYKINDNLYVVGTYGKNFGDFNNVFTLLGLNWGFGNTPLKLPSTP